MGDRGGGDAWVVVVVVTGDGADRQRGAGDRRRGVGRPSLLKEEEMSCSAFSVVFSAPLPPSKGGQKRS